LGTLPERKIKEMMPITAQEVTQGKVCQASGQVRTGLTKEVGEIHRHRTAAPDTAINRPGASSAKIRLISEAELISTGTSETIQPIL
jgi:hypothetical protein